MNIRAIKNASPPAIPLPQTGLLISRRRQKGAAALEYLMLAAAIVAILGVLSADGGIRTEVKNAFTSVFDQAVETVSEDGK